MEIMRMFIVYILVYVIFAYVMYYLGKRSLKSKACPHYIDRWLWYYILFFTLICALRGNTGVDTLTYIHYFKYGFLNGNMGDVNGELAFFYLSSFLSENSIHFSVGLAVCAFLQIYFIVKGLLPYKILLVYLPIVLFGSELFLNMTGIIRQMVSASIFFYATQYIVSRNIVKYVLCIFLASLFHHSSLFLLIMYFIPSKLDVSNRRWLLIVVYLLCIIIGWSPHFIGISHYIQDVLVLGNYERYAGIVPAIFDPEYAEEIRAFGPMQFSYCMLGFFTIWMGPQIGNVYRDKIPVFRLWYLFAVTYICIYFLVCNVSHLMIRSIMSFMLFKAIILSVICLELVRRSRKDISHVFAAGIFIFLLWLNIAWDIVKNLGLPDECVTYKLFFT